MCLPTSFISCTCLRDVFGLGFFSFSSIERGKYFSGWLIIALSFKMLYDTKQNSPGSFRTRFNVRWNMGSFALTNGLPYFQVTIIKSQNTSPRATKTLIMLPCLAKSQWQVAILSLRARKPSVSPPGQRVNNQPEVQLAVGSSASDVCVNAHVADYLLLRL